MLILLLACADPAVVSIKSSGTGPTWHQDVAPLVAARCGGCHTSDSSIAPFALDNYASAAPMAGAMVAAVMSGTMPPWLAKDTDTCAPERPFKDDLRLTDDEKALLSAWADAGAPEGDAATAAVLPVSPSLSVEAPSAELPFPVDYEVPGPSDEYECFILDPGNTEDVWITELQLVPGNTQIAHHGLIFVDYGGISDDLYPEGHYPCFSGSDIPTYQVATWTPGAVVNRLPEGAGSPLRAGAQLIVQMHYHPSKDGPESDRSLLQVRWTEEPPTWEAAHALLGNYDGPEDDGSGLQPGPNDRAGGPEFYIPANSADHTETHIYLQTFNLEIPIYTVGTHMHYVGTDMRVDFNDGGDEECLVQTPDWDFNWQRVYDFDVPVDELPTIGAGDALTMTCAYNNSMSNPFLADALAEDGETEPQDVYLGESTRDEMCLGIFGILVPPGVLASLYN